MKNQPQPVIMLEFNELSPALMDRFIAAGKLPNFERLRAESQVFITEAGEVAPNLEPWIQWITVHTGLPYAEHGIFDLGDGHKLLYPRVEDLLSEAGRKVWICASMNASFRKPPNGHFIPDPWSIGTKPFPEGEFEAFFEYVRRHVQEHSRETGVVAASDHLKFLSFILRRGLSPGTVAAIVRQLAAERSGKFRWKRAAILDRILWDVFAYYWKRERPDFSTFFVNSTAHFQHMYWRNMAPGPFIVKPSPEEQDEYQEAVLFGYQSMDRIVGRCLEMAGKDAVVILASALSQQPCLIYEDKSGKHFYRANKPDDFFAFAGIRARYRYAPVMSEQFHLYFASKPEAAEAARLLAALTVLGRNLMYVRQDGQEVFAGCGIFDRLDGTEIVNSAGGERRAFGELFYRVNGTKSGMHHPDGILWIRDTSRSAHSEQRVSLCRIAPTLLAHFGVELRDYLRAAPLPGYGTASGMR